MKGPIYVGVFPNLDAPSNIYICIDILRLALLLIVRGNICPCHAYRLRG